MCASTISHRVVQEQQAVVVVAVVGKQEPQQRHIRHSMLSLDVYLCATDTPPTLCLHQQWWCGGSKQSKKPFFTLYTQEAKVTLART